jgi:hypothetical protein
MRTSTTETRKHGDELVGRLSACDPAIGKNIGHHPASPFSHALSLCHPERERVEQSETRSSRRILTKSVSENAVSGSSHETAQLTFPDHPVASDHPITRSFFSPCLRASVVDFCLGIARTLRATLREIFDESAYDRFLLRTGASHSAESYRAFMRDRESTMAQKPRCC